MAGKLVTIARFDLAGQAHIAKNALESVGIKSVLADEQTVAMDWLLANAIGGDQGAGSRRGRGACGHCTG